MTCNNVFGNNYHRTCRHSLLKPPRTSSLMIKPNVQVETVKLEIGGFDYLERKFFLKFHFQSSHEVSNLTLLQIRDENFVD